MNQVTSQPGALGSNPPPPAGPPPDWRASGSPSSPKITWEVAPRLGWNEVADYAEGALTGLALGAVDVVSDLWQLASSPIETLTPLVTQPAETLAKAAHQAQKRTGDALRAARKGHFELAGQQHGRYIGQSVSNTALASGVGGLVGKAGAKAADIRAERHLERMSQTPEARARRIELNHGTDSPLVPSEIVLRLPIKPLTEAEARTEALRLERQDRGHSWDRHGPQITLADHMRRITTGVAADRIYSPTKASTHFHTAFDWIATREKALRYAEARYGLEVGKPPATAHGQPRSYEVILEYTRPIDSGVIASGPPHTVPHPVTGKRTLVHSAGQPIEGVTRARTIVAWDDAQRRWVVAQHMPWAKGWDDVRKTYQPGARVDALGVELTTAP